MKLLGSHLLLSKFAACSLKPELHLDLSPAEAAGMNNASGHLGSQTGRRLLGWLPLLTPSSNSRPATGERRTKCCIQILADSEQEIWVHCRVLVGHVIRPFNRGDGINAQAAHKLTLASFRVSLRLARDRFTVAIEDALHSIFLTNTLYGWEPACCYDKTGKSSQLDLLSALTSFMRHIEGEAYRPIQISCCDSPPHLVWPQNADGPSDI